MAVAATVLALKAKLNHANLLDAAPAQRVRTGWEAIDAVLGGGLPAGALHEWFGVDLPDDGTNVRPEGNRARGDARRDIAPNRARRGAERRGAGCCGTVRRGTVRRGTVRRDVWRPPLCLLAHLAWNALLAGAPPRWVVWVGHACFPYPATLARDAGADRSLLAHSLFVAAQSAAHRLWAIDLAVRSPAVGTVIADGSTLSLAATRRLQLLAREYQTPVCLTRPPWEQYELSCAQTRWLVRNEPHVTDVTRIRCAPRWRLELLRAKGTNARNNRGPWLLEWDGDTRTLDLSTEMADPSRMAETSPARQSPASRTDNASREQRATRTA